MTDNATEFAVDALDPEDLEDLESGAAEESIPPRAELPLSAAADVADAVEQTRQVPVDDDEYPR
ncbi:hypothetical protein C7C46_15265 [Streptomyces tateyamensis]|uniref:Uncharacterized protein n=1 Tax=Streptomyces tateyamensis TaxID=565073 RepID=A0A2V4P6W7_9ACTN|nr:hypothetical protein [Streptomyces tateyamensis]PYC78872.1 hypothetical protein C7C46_15265 [Streptomyces tateyamensis]